MSKGGGGSGGRKSSGGVGGRSATGNNSNKLKRAALYAGLYLGAAYLADPVFRQTVNYVGKRAANLADGYIAQNVTPVTAKMRDSVRAWAYDRAAKARGDINTTGVGLDSVRALLGDGRQNRLLPGTTAARGWKSIPDNSVIGFAKGSKTGFRGKDVKNLIRDGIAAAQAGKSEVLNPAPGKYESAARAINLGAVKGKPPRRKKT